MTRATMLVWHPLRPTVSLGITGLVFPGGRLLVHPPPALPDGTPGRAAWGRPGTWCISSRPRADAEDPSGFLILAGIPRVTQAFAIAGELDGYERLHRALEGDQLGPLVCEVARVARALRAGTRPIAWTVG